MSEQELPELSASQKFWAFAAAGLFLLAVCFFGYALQARVALPFAIGWVALQIFGFVGSLKFAKGDFAHPLFKSQVFLHVIALVLLIGLLARG